MPFGKPKKQAAPLNEQGLYDYAVKALGRRMRSEAELMRLMRHRVEHDAHGDAKIGAVVARLREYGFLNDTAFAETFARLRQENEKFGARRVRQDLQRKGVDRELVDQTVAARYDGEDELALARAHLERKRLRKPENDRETARIMRRLVTAGFSVGVIHRLLRSWDVPEESLTALEQLDLTDTADSED